MYPLEELILVQGIYLLRMKDKPKPFEQVLCMGRLQDNPVREKGGFHLYRGLALIGSLFNPTLYM